MDEQSDKGSSLMSVNLSVGRKRFDPETPAALLPWDKADRGKVLAKIKVGDSVWMGDSTFPCKGGIRTVVKLTATQIIVQLNSTYAQRYRREDGYRVGGGSFTDRITGIATEDEIYAFVAKQKADLAEQRRKEDKRTAEENKRKTLNGLFEREHVWVGTNEFSNEAGTYKVSLECLSERAVRELARILNKEFRG
jgi:hypothetical protein